MSAPGAEISMAGDASANVVAGDAEDAVFVAHGGDGFGGVGLVLELGAVLDHDVLAVWPAFASTPTAMRMFRIVPSPVCATIKQIRPAIHRQARG